MNHAEIFAKIEEIAATGARLEKESLLKDVTASGFGRKVLTYAYDPFKTYGIKPKGAIPTGPTPFTVDWDGVFMFLDQLIAREITGAEAQARLTKIMGHIGTEGAMLLSRIVLKDLRCGIGETTINLAVPGLVPGFAVQRAQAYEKRYIKEFPWVIEPKLDGQRNTLLVKNGEGAFFTRSGKVVPALQFLVQPVLDVARHAVTVDPGLCEFMTGVRSFMGGETQLSAISFMLDGEAMMGLFKDTGALRRKDADAEGAELHLYDMMPYDDFNEPGTHGLPLRKRRAYLNRFVQIAHELLTSDGPVQKVPQYFVNSDKEIQTFFEAMLEKPLAVYLARGDKKREAELLAGMIDTNTGGPKMLEGAMVKDPDALYEKRKSRSWLKLKAEETEDLIVIGAYPGESGTKYEQSLGGLIVNRNGVEVRVGGGFSDAQRDEIWRVFTREIAAAAIHDPGAFDHRPDTKGIVWDANKLIPPAYTVVGGMIEVKFHEVTPDGSLRHPRFIMWRDDKQGEKDAA